MRIIYLSEQDEQVAFAQKAAAHFTAHPEARTYSDGNIAPDCFFAVRWGAGDDCVAVLKLDPCHEPVIYAQLVGKE